MEVVDPQDCDGVIMVSIFRNPIMSGRSLTLRHYRNSNTLKLVVLAGLAAAPFTAASAQQRAPQPAARLMVATFAAADKDVGVQVAEAIRQRVTRDFDVKDLYVIPKADVENTLKASGYSTTEALASNDAKALASLLRADEYIDGSVTKTPLGIKVDAKLVLARDNSVTQPLAPAEGANPNAVASKIATAYRGTRPQLAYERNCSSAARGGKFTEAETLARQGLSKVPNGTIVGVCLGSALYSQNKTDSVWAVSQRILAVDPRNINALKWAAAISEEKKDPKAIDYMIQLVAADPSNVKLVQQVVNSIAASGQAPRAVPIIMDAVRTNPGDPQLLHLAWLVLLAAKDFNQAVTVGTEMIRADTAMANVDYFSRTAAAHSALNHFAEAASTLAQGLQKFPNNASMYLVQSQAYSKAGQNAQALAALQKALRIDPKVPGGYLQLVLLYSSANQPDSAYAAVQSASTNGVDKATLGQLMLKLGSDAYKAGNASKNRADLLRAVKYLKSANELSASPDAQFLMGASAFLVGQSAVNEAQDTKSCTMARLAKEHFTIAQENVPAGLQGYPDAAKQLLNAIPQFTPAVDDQIRRFCR
jgi:tetratricopeptide (TPR) repeat protein